MVVIVGMFYWISVQRMEDEAALWRAADELLTFLAATGRKNALIEIANEIDVVLDRTGMDLFTPDRQAEMIVRLKQAHAGFLYSTSGGGAQADTGRGIVAGLCVAFIAIIADRLISAWSYRKKRELGIL